MSPGPGSLIPWSPNLFPCPALSGLVSRSIAYLIFLHLPVGFDLQVGRCPAVMSAGPPLMPLAQVSFRLRIESLVCLPVPADQTK